MISEDAESGGEVIEDRREAGVLDSDAERERRDNGSTNSDELAFDALDSKSWISGLRENDALSRDLLLVEGHWEDDSRAFVADESGYS